MNKPEEDIAIEKLNPRQQAILVIAFHNMARESECLEQEKLINEWLDYTQTLLLDSVGLIEAHKHMSAIEKVLHNEPTRYFI